MRHDSLLEKDTTKRFRKPDRIIAAREIGFNTPRAQQAAMPSPPKGRNELPAAKKTQPTTPWVDGLNSIGLNNPDLSDSRGSLSPR